MDKENDVLNVKRKYTYDPEGRAKLFEDVSSNGFAARRHLPELGLRHANIANGYVRPRILSDLR